MAWAVTIAAAMLLAGGQALALDCADIPGAKIDPSLDASAANQTYGRLFPEFSSRQKSGQVRRTLAIDRLVGKRLGLADGRGHFWLTPAENGATKVTAVSGERVTTHLAQSKLAGLDNAAYNGKLARTFFSLGIAWRDFVPPPVPDVSFGQITAEPATARIAQTTHQLKGAPRAVSNQTVEYACSNGATFVGDPSQLPSMVVLKGTIRARQLTITTTTETLLALTVNDVVEQHAVSYDELSALLGDHPKIAAAVRQMRGFEALKAPEAVQEAATQQPSAEALPAPAANVDGSAGGAPSFKGVLSWPVLLSILAVLCAIVLLLLYHPRFTARRQRDIVPPVADKPPPFEEVLLDVSETAGQGKSLFSKPEPKLVVVADDAEPAAAAQPVPGSKMAADEPQPEAQADAEERQSEPEADAAQPPPEPETAAAEPAAEPTLIFPIPKPDPVAVVAEPQPEPEEAEEALAEPVPEPEPVPALAEAQPEPQASSQPDQPDKTMPDRTMEARIAVLETLQSETETFQDKLKQAIARANKEAADSEAVRDKLAQVESRLRETTAAHTELHENAQDSRSKLNAAREEASRLKEMVVDLKTRLAKASARVESSESIVAELEGASKLAIELNADYRTKTHDSNAENRAMRSRIAVLETAVAERDDLLQSTNQTSEEISKALLDEREERSSIDKDFMELSREFGTLQQSSTARLNQVNLAAAQSENELRASRGLISSLENELQGAIHERKQMQLDHHEKQTENARLRVDHGVRAKLMENNVQELNAHIEALEAVLRDSQLDVPTYHLTPINEPEMTQDPSPEAEPAETAKTVRVNKRGDVLRFRAKG